MMVLILLVVGAPWASAELPWWDDGTMAAVGSWQDPSGEGSDLQLEFSPDGSMLLMVGYGSPDEIRVADRDIQLVTTLSPPGLNATVKGARWSHQGTWVVAWGREEGGSRDYLRAWGTASFERSDSLFEECYNLALTLH